MDTLRAIDCFVKAVDAGTIAGGARLLGISPAAVSQNIARLESHLAVRLLTRTTRRMTLTERGAQYYARVRHLSRDLELAHSAISAPDAEPQGTLRIASTAAFGRHVLAPLIPEFNARHAKLAVELRTTDRSVDHTLEAVDISLRIAPQLEDDLVARRIASIPFRFCASPAYLARAGHPTTPEELKQHDCLVFRMPMDGRILSWGFSRDGLRFTADVTPTLISDDIDVLAQMALADGGITRLADFLAAPYLTDGKLVPLFTPAPDATVHAEVEPMEIYLCVRDRHALTPKVKAFTAFITEQLPRQWRPA